MKIDLLGLVVLSASYFAVGVSDARALDCSPASDCISHPGVSTILYASSVVEASGGDSFEVQVLDVFGAGIGVEPGESIVLPDATPFGDLAGRSLVYVIDGEVVSIKRVDEEDETVACDLVEEVDVEAAAELAFLDDCDGQVRDDYTVSADYCSTGPCEATIGGRPEAFASFLGLFAIGLFARRRRA